jgi:hypothetical protein
MSSELLEFEDKVAGKVIVYVLIVVDPRMDRWPELKRASRTQDRQEFSTAGSCSVFGSTVLRTRRRLMVKLICIWSNSSMESWTRKKGAYWGGQLGPGLPT